MALSETGVGERSVSETEWGPDLSTSSTLEPEKKRCRVQVVQVVQFGLAGARDTGGLSRPSSGFGQGRVAPAPFRNRG